MNGDSKHPLLDTPFKKHVFEGLSAHPKYLSSKYIYDKNGDALFQKIMAMPSYYLTNSELSIFVEHKAAIVQAFQPGHGGFDLIELGAGDGYKTKVLLGFLLDRNIDFAYKPIDISQNAIDRLSAELKKEYPQINVIAEKGEYFEILERLKSHNTRRKVIMVLGSNIGNLPHNKAIEFLSKLKDSLEENDFLFVGFDQKKAPQTILDAYNDTEGLTSSFNKNLLVRINRELGGNFDLDTFKHWEVYDPETGTAKSYLVSQIEQEVAISSIGLSIRFNAWETIHTEISQKYDDATIQWLAEESGLHVEAVFADSREYFKNYLFRRK